MNDFPARTNLQQAIDFMFASGYSSNQIQGAVTDYLALLEKNVFSRNAKIVFDGRLSTVTVPPRIKIIANND